MELGPDGTAQTRCALTMDIDVTGPLAPIVEVFAKGPQKALIAQTITNLREKLEEVYGTAAAAPVPAAPEPAAAPAQPAGRRSLRRRLAAVLARVRRRLAGKRTMSDHP
jgi:hypothetical protein